MTRAIMLIVTITTGCASSPAPQQQEALPARLVDVLRNATRVESLRIEPAATLFSDAADPSTRIGCGDVMDFLIMGRNDDLESEVICFECAQLVITSRDRNTKYGGYFDPSAVVLEAYLEESAWSAFAD